LIVDDEVDLAAACSMVLEWRGHSVESVTAGRTAPEVARRRKPDLVVLDWIMPDIDGGTVLALLRADPATADVPVLMISALADGAVRAREAGADGFLAKPFDADQFLERVESMLGGAAQMASSG
jgi:two-component system chemotaxis response regulator CheY